MQIHTNCSKIKTKKQRRKKMEYKLAKDLPYAKAGSKVKVTSTNYVYAYSTPQEVFYMGIKDQLLKDGWIEEIKRREFWMIIEKSTGRVCQTSQNKKNLLDKWKYEYSADFTEIIKAREVIE
jgi:hypothetical protein